MKFIKESKNYIGILGGFPYIEDENLWPFIPGTKKKMVLLLSMKANLKDSTLADDLYISVFISHGKSLLGIAKKKYVETYLIQGDENLDQIENGFTKVIIHKKSSEPLDLEGNFCFPSYFIENSFDEPLIEDGEEDSKIGGLPFYLSEDLSIDMDQYTMLMQIDELEIGSLSNDYKDIFNGGIGYVFVRNNFLSEVDGKNIGFFFAQY